MAIGAVSNLRDVSQRFSASVDRVVSAARDLSGETPGGDDLAAALVEMSTSKLVVQGTIAAVRTSNELTTSILDIVA
ncbi:MAG: hypothetical protein RL518_2593 [Pseudomonadota bacterium]|jgi:hypothetical protein